MKLTINTCYSRILWIMCQGPIFSNCVESMRIVKGPYHNHEGMTGYIETEAEFVLKDLTKFAYLWDSWFSLSDKKRLDLYGLAKGYGDCK